MVERRSRNTASGRKSTSRQPSASHYVGYVYDEESIESIMKKFEEVDKLKEAVTTPAKGETGAGSAMGEEGSSTTAGDKKDLSEAQLEEIFKRTSMFSMKSIADSGAHVDLDDVWEDELMRYADDQDDDVFSDDDYFDDDDDIWLEYSERPNKRRRTGPGGPRGSRAGGYDRAVLLERYKSMSILMKDKLGNFVTIKKKIRQIDPNIPMYTKVVNTPLSVSWAHLIFNHKPISEKASSTYFEFDDILKTNIKTSVGTGFNCILMDPPLESFDILDKKPYMFPPKELAALKICKDVLPQGFIFIWVPKAAIPPIMELMDSWGLGYVENICWARMSVNNRIVEKEAPYLNTSKSSLMIFRKRKCGCDLRHQRSPDVVFDFEKPLEPKYRAIADSEYVPEHKPEYIYEIIETLLPGTKQTGGPDGQKGKLLELWARPNTTRDGWVSVANKVSV
eukprot:Nk52_evm40s255 gene=Nk52_evmTU40s255